MKEKQNDDIFSDNADVKINSKPGESIDVANFLVKNDVPDNHNNLEKEGKTEYNSIAEAIEDDTRKKKFLNHSNSVSYFNLDYDVMDEINAIVSAKAHKSINDNVVNFTQLIESDYKIYNIYADILEDDYYYINNAEELRKEVENDFNERIKKQNNGLPVRNSTNEQREFIANTESVINTRTNTKLSELSRGQQRGFNNQSIDKKVTRDSRKNLNVKNSKELDKIYNFLKKKGKGYEKNNQSVQNDFEKNYRENRNLVLQRTGIDNQKVLILDKVYYMIQKMIKLIL